MSMFSFLTYSLCLHEVSVKPMIIFNPKTLSPFVVRSFVRSFARWKFVLYDQSKRNPNHLCFPLPINNSPLSTFPSSFSEKTKKKLYFAADMLENPIHLPNFEINSCVIVNMMRRCITSNVGRNIRLVEKSSHLPCLEQRTSFQRRRSSDAVFGIRYSKDWR